MQLTRDTAVSLPGADDIRAAIIPASDWPTQKSSAPREPRNHEIVSATFIAINPSSKKLGGHQRRAIRVPRVCQNTRISASNAGRDQNSPITATR